MKQLHLTTMCIVCAVLMGFLSSCSKNEEEPAVPPVSGGQTGPADQGPLPWDGEYPSIDDAKLLLQGALVQEAEGLLHRNNVILISSAKHLAAMNVLITNGETIKDPKGVELTCARLRYRLTTDIDLNNKPWTSIGGMEYGSGTNFQGDFDGQGYTIKNLNVYYNDGEKDVTEQYAGLFRSVIPSVDDPSWGISHLIVEGMINVLALKSCYAGGISALSQGNIKFCRFNGDINIRLLYPSNNFFCVGGIVGRLLQGKVTSCIGDASINCDASYSSPTIRKGGLIGQSEGGYYAHAIISYSAWNSVSEKSMIGYIPLSNSYTNETADKDFTDIATLNALLPDMNIVVTPENTHIWQANPNAQGYPLLVKKE